VRGAPAFAGDHEQYPAKPVLRIHLQRRGIPIAAGILYPHFGILLSPIIAAGPWRFLR